MRNDLDSLQALKLTFRTSLYRRLLNVSRRRPKRSLTDLADDFVRLYRGYFDAPMGTQVMRAPRMTTATSFALQFRFSCAEDTWLLVLDDIRCKLNSTSLIDIFLLLPVANNSTNAQRRTRIIFLRKGVKHRAR